MLQIQKNEKEESGKRPDKNVKTGGKCYMRDNEKNVPIHQKVTLTIEEAAAYSNIGQNKLSHLLKSPRCPFVLFVGTKKLVKRREFERFISESIEI